MKPTLRASLGLTLLWIALFVLSACQTVPSERRASGLPPAATLPPGDLATAKKAEDAGEYVVAAREYRRLAQTAGAPQRQDYAMKAVEALLKAGQVREARDEIAAIDVHGLDPGFLGRKQILEARVASAEGQHEQAIAFLTQAERAGHLEPDLLAQIYLVRSQEELALGHPLRAARNLIGRERYIVGKDQIAANEERLWQTLTGVDTQRLQQERAGATDLVLIGWLDLALAGAHNPPGSPQLARAVEDWRRAHPNHPASEDFLHSLIGSAPALLGRVERVALLLPLTSEYTPAAQAVRDGFIAMQTVDPDPAKPQVKVYDIGADAAQAPAFYAQAVQDGAQLVVGPLGVEATDQVVKHGLTAPTLLLTHIDGDIAGSERRVYQFGLPPEQEARQAAERAYLDGRRRVAVLYPNSPLGQRLATAFNDYWQRLGGVVVAQQAYTPQQGDYAEPVKLLLSIDKSEARKADLEKLLRTRIKLDPRPRNDIDSIFFAGDARQGRLIKPQFNYFRAGRIPVYATSYVFSGKADPTVDTDLDGVMFGDMPWMIAANPRIETLRSQLQSNWPYAHTPLDRLFALGVDAYALIPQLDRLSTEGAARYNGVTSGLSIERYGELHRQLLWARFRRGVPQLLDTFLPYKGQFQTDDGNRTPNAAASSRP